MPMKDKAVLYKGMTEKQLQEAYNLLPTIPNARDWLQENRQRAHNIKNKLSPICNISYGKEAIQKLDIYAPKSCKNAPVLIDIHGGGWSQGSKNASSISAGLFWQEYYLGSH